MTLVISKIIVNGKRANMTKLQFLNDYFTERLMAVVQEMIEVVGDTLLEYQVETGRTKRENERLRRRLLEVGLDADAGLNKCSQPVSQPVSVDKVVIEQHEWSSTLDTQDTESTLTAVKVELTEQHGDRQEEEELRRLEPDTPGSIPPTPNVKSECSQDSRNQSIFPLSCVERECHQEPLNHSDLKMQIVNADEVRTPSSVMVYQVKTETGGVDYSTSEQHAESLSFDVNLNGNTVANKSRISICRAETGGQMSESDEPLSTETLNPLKGQSTHSCPQCGKTYRYMSQVRRHLLRHSKEKPFSCAVCGKRFSYTGYLRAHQQVHTGVKSHCCNVCGKYFSKLAYLKRHLRVHTGEKPYSCPVCGKCFSQSSQMKRHLQIHSN